MIVDGGGPAHRRRPSARARPARATSAQRRPVLEVVGLAQPLAGLGRQESPTRPRTSPRRSAGASCIPGAISHGIDVPSSRWSWPPVACSTIQRHSVALTIRRSSGSSWRPPRESIADEARRADVAREAPAVLRPRRDRSRTPKSWKIAAEVLLGARAVRDRQPAPAPRPRPARRGAGCRRAGRSSRSARRRPSCAPTSGSLRLLLTIHAHDVFQSSCTSWSSKIIAVGHDGEEPADQRRAPGVAVEQAVLLEVARLLLGTADAGPRRLSTLACMTARARRRRPGRRRRTSARARRRGPSSIRSA